MMENRMNILLLLLLFISSCDKKSGLELTILNKELVAYCPNNDCLNLPNIYLEDNFYNKANNKISFKIENHDNKTYAFISNCHSSNVRGCYTEDVFPQNYRSITTSNLIFYNSSNKVLEPEFVFTNRLKPKLYDYNKTKDTIVLNYYNKIGYREKSNDWKKMNSEITNKLVIIHPNETLFFETYITIPFVYNLANDKLFAIPLEANEAYQAKLIFNTSLKDISQFLSESQKKTFETNNYVLYTNNIESINNIPVKFKN